MPQCIHTFCCPRWERKPRNGVCTPGTQTLSHTLLKNKQEMQCEGSQARKEEIRDGSEINRRHLIEDTRNTRYYNAVPAPTSPSKLPPQDKMTSGESLAGRTGGKYWPHHYMHWIWLGIWLGAGFTAILQADLAALGKPGPGEWVEEVPQ